jgi:hypothetical protein
VIEAFLQENRQDFGDHFRRTGDQQAAAGLRIGQQGLFKPSQVLRRRFGHVVSVARPVAIRGAGNAAFFGIIESVGQ